MLRGQSRCGTSRYVAAVRLLILSGILIGVVGFAGRGAGLMTVTSTVGPTGYLLLAHPNEVTARLRNAVVGHAVAVCCALSALAGFGLWDHPSVTRLGQATPAQVIASAAAVAVTLAFLEIVRAHHAPAAATSLLITTGLAHPGRPLFGLFLGLSIVLLVSPLLARLPGGRS